MLEPVLNNLLSDLRGLVNSARARAAASVNSELVMLYWHIGKRLHLEFSATRLTYGEQILQAVAKSLTTEFGHGFSKSSLSRATRFYEICPEEKIVATVWQQLSWSHIPELLPLKDPLQRDFYAQMTTLEHQLIASTQAREEEKS